MFLPLRIGYGATGGEDVEFSGRCNDRRYEPAYEAGAAQTLAVIEYAKSLPFIRRDEGIVAGQSMGGTIAIAVAAKNVAGIKAALNFAGGGGGNPSTHAEQPCSLERLTALFAGYGETARIPTLWLYSENDKYWGPQLPRDWAKAFSERGGRAEFVQLPPYKDDGHPSFTGNPEGWKPAVEKFLSACCAPDIAPAPAPGKFTAQSREVFTRVLEAWLTKHGARRASIVVRRNGRIVHQAGIGGEDPKEPVLLASLSKAITGTCVATLVRDRKLGFETTVSSALVKFIGQYGEPADPRLNRVTISQLLTHRAGFPSNDDGEDFASHSVLDAYLQRNSARGAPGPEYVRGLLTTQLVREPGSAFAYSNAGYLLLGAIIEEATGRRYDDYCRDAVLTPTGASGKLDPTLAVLWSYGGWHMSGADYLAFYDVFNSKSSLLGAQALKWMADRRHKTYGRTSYPVWYGLGVRQRDRDQGLEIWHTGSWARKLPSDEIGSRNINTSTLAFRMADGLSVFVHSTPLVLGAARNELMDELIRAARTITTWQ